MGTADHDIRVEKAKLPGFGVRQEFSCSSGSRVGIITLKTGGRMLVIYHDRDPDRALASVKLDDTEAALLAELLGSPGATARLARLQEQVEGVLTANIGLTARSPYIGRTLGETAIRSRTGASVVAIYRGDDVIASPEPSFIFEPDDRVIVVGTEAGVSEASHLLSPG